MTPDDPSMLMRSQLSVPFMESGKAESRLSGIRVTREIWKVRHSEQRLLKH